MSLDWLKIYELKEKLREYPHVVIAEAVEKRLLKEDRTAEIVKECTADWCRILGWIDYNGKVILVHSYIDLYMKPGHVSVDFYATRMAEEYAFQWSHSSLVPSLEDLMEEPDSILSLASSVMMNAVAGASVETRPSHLLKRPLADFVLGILLRLSLIHI